MGKFYFPDSILNFGDLAWAGRFHLSGCIRIDGRNDSYVFENIHTLLQCRLRFPSRSIGWRKRAAKKNRRSHKAAPAMLAATGKHTKPMHSHADISLTRFSLMNRSEIKNNRDRVRNANCSRRSHRNYRFGRRFEIREISRIGWPIARLRMQWKATSGMDRRPPARHGNRAVGGRAQSVG